MIVPMKKAAVIMQQKDAQGALSVLKKFGILHIEHQQPPKGKNISLLQEDLTLLNNALEVISEEEFVEKITIGKEQSSPVDWRRTAIHITELAKRLERLAEYFGMLNQQINEWKVWGDFNPQDILRLAENNIHIGLYRLPRKELHKIPIDAVIEEILVKEGIVYCAVITKESVDFGFKEVELPKLGLLAMQERLLENEKVVQELKVELKKHIYYYNSLLKVKKSLQKEIEFQEALNGMTQAEHLSYLVGYVPKENEKELLALAKKEEWGIVITHPAEEDSVPTLIRNPKWVSLISPIFRFLEILPGYRELDISLPFLIFFSIFFGVLIGDAGYGLVYLLLTFLLQRKFKKKVQDKSVFFLFYLLSICAVIWGLLTGTFFGQEWFLKAGYKPLLPALNDEKGIQRFCFFLGALHLSIAHGWRGILKAPSLSALGDLGWICILWSAFFIAKTLILGDAFPSFCVWLFISGAALIILVTNPQKNILKSSEEWISWLVTLPFSFVSNFADVVSYIRLFAVGLAGIAIADAFNAMAAMVKQGNMLMIVLAVFIAFTGNALGIVLGPVSVLVHGVRLNLLEFSGHANISWSGTAYKPLKE